MSNLTDKIYSSFTEEQLNRYRTEVWAALNRGIPKQMIFQYFLQAAYATLDELGAELTQDEQNQVAVEIAHKLYMRITQDDGSQSNDNSDSGA